MSDHLSLQEMVRHFERKLSPKELIAIDDHLASCDKCFSRFKELSQVPETSEPIRINLWSELDDGSHHLSYDEQIVAYVDNELDEIEREIVENHIEICQLCADEVRDLQQFKKVVSVSIQKRPISIQKEPKTITQSTTPEKFFAMFRWTYPRWKPSYIMGMAAIIGVFLLIGVFLFRARIFNQQEPIAREVHSNNNSIGPTPPPPSTNTSTNPEMKEDKERQTQKSGLEPDVNKPKDEKKRKTEPTEKKPGTAMPELYALRDGNRSITIDKSGNIKGLETLPKASQKAVSNALIAQEIKKPVVLASLLGASSGLRDPSVEGLPFTLISPAGTVVQSESPAFRWRPLNGATGYIVSVFNTKSNQVVRSEQLSTTEWTIPHSLERGVIYSWQVTALKNDERITSPIPPSQEVQFKVIEEEKAAKLSRVAKTFANSHLVLGVHYAEQGLLDEAEREFQSLVKANPRSQVARKLLRSIQSWRSH